MNNIECPYCKKEFEVCQDDGFATNDGEIYEQECPHCEKNFALVPSISWSFSASKADCMNGGKHSFMVEERLHPWNVGRPYCLDCQKRITVDIEANKQAVEAWRV